MAYAGGSDMRGTCNTSNTTNNDRLHFGASKLDLFGQTNNRNHCPCDQLRCDTACNTDKRPEINQAFGAKPAGPQTNNATSMVQIMSKSVQRAKCTRMLPV